MDLSAGEVAPAEASLYGSEPVTWAEDRYCADSHVSRRVSNSSTPPTGNVTGVPGSGVRTDEKMEEKHRSAYSGNNHNNHACHKSHDGPLEPPFAVLQAESHFTEITH